MNSPRPENTIVERGDMSYVPGSGDFPEKRSPDSTHFA
jgi:hypothetical protein